MNRTLLLIICDFLLLSLLALARFDQPEQEPPIPEKQVAAEEGNDSPEADLIEMLRLSLETEQESQIQLSQQLETSQEELAQQLSNEKERQAREQKELTALKQQLETEKKQSSQRVTLAERQLLEAEQSIL